MKSHFASQSDSPRTARNRVKENETGIHKEAYTPLPRQEPHRGGRLRAGIVTAIAVAAVVAGIGIRSLISERHSPLDPPVLAVSATQVREAQVFVLSSQDLDIEATEQARAALARGEVPPTLRNAPLETRQQIASGEQQLYTVRLMDFADEDGDAVSVAINGLPFAELVLANGGARLTIPLKPGERAIISITAVRDGGGGVTFRAISSRGEMRTRVMPVGESETWTVVFQ